eukprot:c16075_g1_i1.p1 GENE.c16075_g1_i1~~c16075_g1_i1.p1  ORF type:complete len:285 (-),score=54.91 c16075_g1_i1:72-926(-)
MLVWSVVVISIFSGIGLIISIGYGLFSQKKLIQNYGPDADNFSCDRIITSGFKKINTKTLFLFRFTYFLFCCGIIITDLVLHGQTTLVFYTFWNYCIQTVYFGLTSIHYLYFKQQPESAPKIRSSIYILFQLNLTLVLFVSFVTWVILLPDALAQNKEWILLNFVSYCEHAINVLIIVTEFILNTMNIQIFYFTFVIAWLLLYSVFCVIFQLSGGFSPYFFTSIDSPYTILWLIGIIFVLFLFYLFTFGLGKLKTYFLSSSSSASSSSSISQNQSHRVEPTFLH